MFHTLSSTPGGGGGGVTYVCSIHTCLNINHIPTTKAVSMHGWNNHKFQARRSEGGVAVPAHSMEAWWNERSSHGVKDKSGLFVR